MHTTHRIHFGPAQRMNEVPDASIALTVTSPPYPMIEMWDESFGQQNPAIRTALAAGDGQRAFDLMHLELEKVWGEVARVTLPGGFVCINIGDATRTLEGTFQLFPNHARIINFFLKNGFVNLPNVLWRKPTNAPNKFMGSGMLPAGAYVTLEHEYILIFRKGGKRIFKTEAEKRNRQESAFFWEERNQWFSDLWEFRGTGQKLALGAGRDRSGAFPFELPYRLISMYSVKGDTVLDPFVGTGTTTLAAIAAGRDSVGYEVDETLRETIFEAVSSERIRALNLLIRERLQAHVRFVEERSDLKHHNAFYDFSVMTSQETELRLNFVQRIDNQRGSWGVEYQREAVPDFSTVPPARKGVVVQQVLAF
jgi:DNA modification methylase